METANTTEQKRWMDYQQIKSLGGSRWSDLELPELLETLPHKQNGNGEVYLVDDSSLPTFLPYQA